MPKSTSVCIRNKCLSHPHRRLKRTAWRTGDSPHDSRQGGMPERSTIRSNTCRRRRTTQRARPCLEPGAAGLLSACRCPADTGCSTKCVRTANASRDRKSTRLNSSHVSISYAVFCLKKKIMIRYRLERHGEGGPFVLLVGAFE